MKQNKFYELYIGSAERENGGKSAFIKTNKCLDEDEALHERMLLDFAVLENVVTQEEVDDINSHLGFIVEIEEDDIDEGCEFIKI